MSEDTRAEDFLRPQEESPIKLRPLSSGSYAILHKTGNAFVRASSASETTDHLGAALEYAFVHGAPLEAVLRAAYSAPEVFHAEVFRFSQAIPVEAIPAIIREVEAGLTAAASQSVEVVPRPGVEEKDAPPNF